MLRIKFDNSKNLKKNYQNSKLDIFHLQISFGFFKQCYSLKNHLFFVLSFECLEFRISLGLLGLEARFCLLLCEYFNNCIIIRFYKFVYFLYTLLCKSKINMKEAPDFYLIDSDAQNSNHPERSQHFFEQEKIAYYAEEAMDKEQEQQSLLKTPKSKRGRKFSLKNNPEDHSASKMSKIKDKKYKNMMADKQKNPNQLFGHWSVEQNKRYHWFLQIYHSHFMNRSLRRMDRIFTSMAKFVSTREAQQCRSHHQKMQKKHKTFPRILLSLRMSHYGNHSDILLREDIENNQVGIIEPLLTEQFLIQNLTLKETINSVQNSKEQRKSQNQDISDQRPQEMIQPAVEIEAGIIEQVLAPEYESSKNYFKILCQNQERNNILDDGYQSNLPFNGFF